MDRPKRLDHSADLVAQYLQDHPEFFRDYPDLLPELAIPHHAGAGVASLIERQVQMLRAQKAQLQQELDQRRTRASRQRQLLQEVLGTTARIMRGRSGESIHATVERCLRQNYAADEFRVFVFRDGEPVADTGRIRILPRSAKLKYLFIELLNRNKPLCGSLQDEHIRMLFQAAEEHVSSTWVMPLRHVDWEGLIAVGSREQGHYGRSVEMDLAQHLLSVFGMRLDELMRTVTA